MGWHDGLYRIGPATGGAARGDAERLHLRGVHRARDGFRVHDRKAGRRRDLTSWPLTRTLSPAGRGRTLPPCRARETPLQEGEPVAAHDSVDLSLVEVESQACGKFLQLRKAVDRRLARVESPVEVGAERHG